MTDKPRKPPPLRPKDGPELVRITDDPAPDTEKVPIPLPEPKALPLRPPAGIVGLRRAPNLLEEVEGLRNDVAAIYAGQRETIATQRSMARQLDGFGVTINNRFDVFHTELALLRATVTGDHGPRLDGAEKAIQTVQEDVKKATPADKAKAVGMFTARFGAWGTGALFFGGLALRALAKLYPQYGELIDGILSGVGIP